MKKIILGIVCFIVSGVMSYLSAVTKLDGMIIWGGIMSCILGFGGLVLFIEGVEDLVK